MRSSEGIVRVTTTRCGGVAADDNMSRPCWLTARRGVTVYLSYSRVAPTSSWRRLRDLTRMGRTNNLHSHGYLPDFLVALDNRSKCQPQSEKGPRFTAAPLKTGHTSG